MKKIDVLKKITEDLKLDFELQDWGIVNSSPNRIEEFIKYFKGSNYSEREKYELFELIISSYNDYLISTKEKSKVFENFIKENKNSKIYKSIIEYWKSLDNEEEFPASAHL